MGGAGEIAGDDVAEQLAADRAAPRRGADHRDTGGREEARERRGHPDVVAAVDAVEVARGRIDRERHLGHAAVVLALDLEARALEHAQHGAVVGQHLGEEGLDADPAGLVGELLEQAGADALALELVGHREGDFGPGRIAQADVGAERHDALAVRIGDRPRQRPALDPVGVEHRVHQPRSGLRVPVEPQVPALLGQMLEEGDHAVLVIPQGRPQAHRGAVAQDHVARRDRHQCARSSSTGWPSGVASVPSTSASSIAPRYGDR